MLHGTLAGPGHVVCLQTPLLPSTLLSHILGSEPQAGLSAKSSLQPRAHRAVGRPCPSASGLRAPSSSWSLHCDGPRQCPQGTGLTAWVHLISQGLLWLFILEHSSSSAPPSTGGPPSQLLMGDTSRLLSREAWRFPSIAGPRRPAGRGGALQSAGPPSAFAHV